MATKWVEHEPTLHRFFGPNHSGDKKISTDTHHAYYFGGEGDPISPDAEVRLVYRLTTGDTPEIRFGPNQPRGRFISAVGMNYQPQPLALNGPITDFFLFVEEPA